MIFIYNGIFIVFCNYRDNRMRLLEIYTDGSLRRKNNIKRASSAIYFPNREFNNISEEIDMCDIHYAELYAIKRALSIIINSVPKYNKITFYTDSNHCINKINKWYSIYKNNEIDKMKTKRGNDIKNKNLLLEVYNLIGDNMDKFEFEFVKAHTNGKNQKTLNNKLVDKLAKSKTKI